MNREGARKIIEEMKTAKTVSKRKLRLFNLTKMKNFVVRHHLTVCEIIQGRRKVKVTEMVLNLVATYYDQFSKLDKLLEDVRLDEAEEI